MRNTSRINHLEKQIESVRVAAKALINPRRIFNPDKIWPEMREEFFELQKRCPVTEDGVWDTTNLTDKERRRLTSFWGHFSPIGPNLLDSHKKRR